MRVSREIGQYKKEHSMQVVQTQRYGDVLNSRISLAEEMGMSGDFMKVVMEAIHEESVRQQIVIVNKKDDDKE
jgi:chorismate mutase